MNPLVFRLIIEVSNHETTFTDLPPSPGDILHAQFLIDRYTDRPAPLTR